MCLSQIFPPGFAARKDRLEEEAFLANPIRNYIGLVVNPDDEQALAGIPLRPGMGDIRQYLIGHERQEHIVKRHITFTLQLLIFVGVPCDRVHTYIVHVRADIEQPLG